MIDIVVLNRNKYDDRYNMPRLTVLCEEALVSSLKIDNAAQYFALADFYDVKPLLRAVKRFILSNFKQVKATDGWKGLKDHAVDLLDQLLDDVAHS